MDVLELPFDQYQRYRLVADLVEELRPRGRRLRILARLLRVPGCLLRAMYPRGARGVRDTTAPTPGLRKTRPKTNHLPSL